MFNPVPTAVPPWASCTNGMLKCQKKKKKEEETKHLGKSHVFQPDTFEVEYTRLYQYHTSPAVQAHTNKKITHMQFVKPSSFR